MRLFLALALLVCASACDNYEYVPPEPAPVAPVDPSALVNDGERIGGTWVSEAEASDTLRIAPYTAPPYVPNPSTRVSLVGLVSGAFAGVAVDEMPYQVLIACTRGGSSGCFSSIQLGDPNGSIQLTDIYDFQVSETRLILMQSFGPQTEASYRRVL